MGNDYDFYNLVEKCIIEIPLTIGEETLRDKLQLQTKLIKDIKGLAMCLSRFKPADWNKFLDVVIN